MRLVMCAVLLSGVCLAQEVGVGVDLGIGDSPTPPVDMSEVDSSKVSLVRWTKPYRHTPSTKHR